MYLNDFPDLIFVSMENWDEIWRRNQFLCAGFAKRLPHCKILFVGLPKDVSHQVRRGNLSALRGKATWTVPAFPNITVTHPLKLAPNTLAAGRRLNEVLARVHVRRVARCRGITDPILWLNPHYAVHMAGRMCERAVIYDITDDWTLASFPLKEKRQIESQDCLLCRRADLVVVCSEALAQSRRTLCKNILLLPNGVDTEHYRCVFERTKNEGMAKWSSPVFGYTGTLHPDRIDAGLIVALARAFPDGSVVLIGPDHLDSETRELLTAEKSVFLQGPVPYACISEYMTEFDVCIVPHQESPFTESLNPIKLWEYLACGKPIVSTNIAGFRDFPNLCYVASGQSAFISACRMALGENGSKRSERREEATKHSWDSRIDCLLSAMRSLGAP